MQIRPGTNDDFKAWQVLRRKLWSHVSDAENQGEFQDYQQNSDKTFILLAETDGGEIIGFLETSIREDYVEGCETSRVGYIEGWFVEEEFRRKNVGRRLVEAAEDWARRLGCLEMASDCELENQISFAAHTALGYDETNRIIHFKKWL